MQLEHSLRAERSIPNVTTPPARPHGTLVCKTCRTRIVAKKCMLSSAFRGFSGKAGLFSQAANVLLGKPFTLLMDTGAHTVREFSCTTCSAYLGWKIVRAHEGPEKWKEGNYVLESEHLVDEAETSVLPPLPCPTKSGESGLQQKAERRHRRPAIDDALGRVRPKGPRTQSTPKSL